METKSDKTKKRPRDLEGKTSECPRQKKIKMVPYNYPKCYPDMTKRPGQMELDEILDIPFPFNDISPNDLALLSKIGGGKVINNIVSIMEKITIKDVKGNDIRSNKVYNVLKKTQSFFGIYLELENAYDKRQKDCFEFSTTWKWAPSFSTPTELSYLRWLEDKYIQLVGWTQTHDTT